MPTWFKRVFVLCALAATLAGCYGIGPDPYYTRSEYYGAPYRDYGYGAYRAPVAVYRGGFGYAPHREYVGGRAYRAGVARGYSHGYSRGYARSGHRRG